MEKRWIAIGAVVIGVFLFIILLVPFFVNADSFRPAVESQLSNALAREVTLGRLSLAVLEGSLTAEDIAIADDPAFSKVPFLQAKKLVVGVEMLPLLIHHEVRITKLIVDTPSIQLIEHASGKWNYSSLGVASSISGQQSQSGSAHGLRVGEVKITNGSALVSTIPVIKNPFAFSNVNLSIKKFSFESPFPFDLSAKVPGEGKLKLTGDAGPISRSDASKTPFRAKLELRNFDPVAAGVIDKGKGVSVVGDADAEIASDGIKVSSMGKITASRLQLSPRGAPAQQPVEMDYTVSQSLETWQGTVSDITVHTGSVEVHVNGSFQSTPENLMLNLRLSVPGLPIDEVERVLPVVGIRLPSGSSLQGGTITANISIAGPAAAANWTGPVEIENTKLAGFNLGSEIQGLGALGGARTGTQIQVLKANVDSSPDGTRITDIYGDFPQIGSATGAGTMAPSGAIDFQLTARLSSSNAVGTITKQTSLGGRGVPVTISGSASNPSIRANVGTLVK